MWINFFCHLLGENNPERTPASPANLQTIQTLCRRIIKGSEYHPKIPDSRSITTIRGSPSVIHGPYIYPPSLNPVYKKRNNRSQTIETSTPECTANVRNPEQRIEYVNRLKEFRNTRKLPGTLYGDFSGSWYRLKKKATNSRLFHKTTIYALFNIYPGCATRIYDCTISYRYQPTCGTLFKQTLSTQNQQHHKTNPENSSTATTAGWCNTID